MSSPCRTHVACPGTGGDPITRARGRRPAAWLGTCVAALLAAGASAQVVSSNFEMHPVHGAEVSRDGTRLFVVHPAAGRLVVFSLLDPRAPVPIETIPVGLEPTSVRLRDEHEAWVTNRLSDSISVVSLAQRQVVATIRTADAPADVVFAGHPRRAFVAAAGADLVQVLDPEKREEVGRIAIFGEEPTALAVDASGERVWCAVHRSGNGTTVVPMRFAPPQPKPKNPLLPDAPQAELIVAADDPAWKPKHGITLPDVDVVEIDAKKLRIGRTFSRAGTTLFGVAVHPARDELWVANTEAHNTVRFEPMLRGRFVSSRVTRIDLGPTALVTPLDLNPGVDLDLLPNPAALGTALAQPTGLVFSPGGEELWVAAFGTDRLARLDAGGHVLDRVEVGDTPGALAAPRNKRGPRSLAHHPGEPLLYVVNSLSGSVAVVDTRLRRKVAEVGLGPDPLPAGVRAGRGFLYDAKLSGNGLVSCASCHVDARRDGLAWDLGDPWGVMRTIDRTREPFVTFELHPMKGPLLTQTLLGIGGDEPFHWRGDRANLEEFNSTFSTLLGGAQLGAEDLGLLVEFMTGLQHAPNPNQNPDRTYTDTPKGESARDGFAFFQSVNFSGAPGGPTCASCHARPSGGSDEVVINRESAQYMAVPQLRGLYERTGRRPQAGLSKSGFGILHAGHEDGVFEFLSSDLPFLGKLRGEDANKRMLERFLLEFDTGTAPAVGRAVTVTAKSATSSAVRAELALLVAQAAAGNCGLVADLGPAASRRAWAWDPARAVFVADAKAEPPRTLDSLLGAATANAPITFLATPFRLERRFSIDRDGNGVLDGDERPAPYGVPTPRCSDTRLESASSPRVGGALALVVRGAPDRARGSLLLGESESALQLFDLTLLVDPYACLVLPATVDRHGVAAAAIAIPNDSGLVGRTLRAQALFPASCGVLRAVTSNGIRAKVE